MYKIYIDSTEKNNIRVSLIRDDVTVKEVMDVKDIVVAVKNLLEENGLAPDDISAYSANPGPGSFTGIRMGLAVANTINWALNKENTEPSIDPKYGAEPNITPPKKFKLL